MSEKSSFFETDTGTAKPEQWKKSPSCNHDHYYISKLTGELVHCHGNWVRNQTLADVEKIINLGHEGCHENECCKQIKEEIKNLKVTEVVGSSPTASLEKGLLTSVGRGLSKEENGASPLQTGIVPTSRKGLCKCGHKDYLHQDNKGFCSYCQFRESTCNEFQVKEDRKGCRKAMKDTLGWLYAHCGDNILCDDCKGKDV